MQHLPFFLHIHFTFCDKKIHFYVPKFELGTENEKFGKTKIEIWGQQNIISLFI